MLKIKDKEYYETNKKFFNTHYNRQWKTIAGRPYLGSCSYLFMKYKPVSYDDFLQKYLEDYDTENYDELTCRGDKHKGRSEEQLINLAKKYLKLCNNDKVTLEMCLDDIVNHAIIETFDGHQAELVLINLINGLPDFYAQSCEDDMDASYGVDVVVRRKENNKISNFIQVKPISTFLGDKNRSLVEDRKNFFNKQEKLNIYLTENGQQDEIREIEYMCYDKQHYNRTNEVLFLNSGGKTRHRLIDLCYRNGIPKIDYKNCIFTKIN